MKRPLRVLITGAGLAGLTAAAYCERYGIQYTLIDRTAGSGVGFALFLWPNAMRVLEDLGVGTIVAEKGYSVETYSVQTPAGSIKKPHVLGKLTPAGEKCYHIRRHLLYEALRGKIHSNADVRFGTTISTLKQDAESVRVQFNDATNSEEQFDVIVGTDGVHSSTRSLLFGGKTNTVQQTGLTGWFFWLPPKLAETYSGNTNLFADSVFFSVYPEQDKCFFCGYLAMPANDNRENDPARRVAKMKHYVSAKSPFLKTVADQLPDDPSQYYNNVHQKIYLDTWHRGRGIVIGDAAHTDSPFIGMGAAMALEDACLLGKILATFSSDTSIATIETAFEQFAAHRRHRVAEPKRLSGLVEWATSLPYPFSRMRNLIIGWGYDHVFLPRLKNSINRKIDI